MAASVNEFQWFDFLKWLAERRDVSVSTAFNDGRHSAFNAVAAKLSALGLTSQEQLLAASREVQRERKAVRR